MLFFMKFVRAQFPEVCYNDFTIQNCEVILMYEYHDIRTKEDAQQLLELFNGFHDAYITNYT